MKLLIKEYLASLRERDELDAILPDLLSQMGLNVFISPSRGTKEYGVDIAAAGSIDGGEEKLYLFSVKSGNLTRSTWSGSSNQALLPSLDEIIYGFIPSRIPSEHSDKPIEICLCFGGDIASNIRQEVSGYTTSKSQRNNVTFSEWNGDKLAEYIEQHLLQEDFVPEHLRSQLRKSLAMIDEPEVSFKHFSYLIHSLTQAGERTAKDNLTSIRQLYISLWILYAWCREENNLESAYLSSESVLLHAWDLSKSSFGQKNKTPRSIQETLDAILKLHIEIANHFLEVVVLPHTDKLYALSSAVNPACSVDTNLKLFDILGRLSMAGIWAYWLSTHVVDGNSEANEKLYAATHSYHSSLKQLITNNPILFSPYKDEQAIDIMLALWFLGLDGNNQGDINNWLSMMADGCYFFFQTNNTYPSTIENYAELIEHPIDDTESYRESVTKGSILYPYISVFSAIFGFDQPYRFVQKLKADFLEHCNFQVWYPGDSSEEHFYKNDANHGGTLSDVSIDKEPSDLLKEIFDECEESNQFRELSAIKYSLWPIIFLACRHHRQPIPMHFFQDIHKQAQRSIKVE
jgi:hypothetical protein